MNFTQSLSRGLVAAALFFCCESSFAADRAHTVNIFAWPEYFPPDLIKKFESQYGMHVNYTVLDSPESAETLLAVGSSNYDLVTMNAAPKILALLSGVDPGNQHAVPWMWGTTGIIYNVDKIQSIMPAAPIDSLDMILKKEVAAKFAPCGIGFIDSWGDIMPMVARFLGQGALSADPAKLAAVKAKLDEIRPYIRRVSTSGYYQQLAEGELCLAIGYSGDALIARRMVAESQGKIRIGYSFAREIVPFYIDSMVIPTDSPNPTGAMAFMNFVMQPETSASVTRFIGFATANEAAVPLLEPAVRDNAVIYPPVEVRNRFELQKVYTPEEARAFDRVWLEFKSGQ